MNPGLNENIWLMEYKYLFLIEKERKLNQLESIIVKRPVD